jgi:predicted nucleotidyltransferase component of viral defense system
VLDQQELTEIADAFGASEAQVRRDHLISHVLLIIAELQLPVVFFGGTALARTHLTDPHAGGRLSEDIDLYAFDRKTIAGALDTDLPRALRREYPGTHWDPAPARSGRSIRRGW